MKAGKVNRAQYIADKKLKAQKAANVFTIKNNKLPSPENRAISNYRTNQSGNVVKRR